MKRRDILAGMATAAGAFGVAGGVWTNGDAASAAPNRGKPLSPPANGPVRVGFVVGAGLVEIDLFGPLGVFGDAQMSGDSMIDRFDVYTIGPSKTPIDVGGMKSEPQYTFIDAPQPHVLVVPGQRSSPEMIAYIKETAKHADVTMSVCTGAFPVAKAGLFDDGRATTHHGAYQNFEREFPRVKLIRGVRFVEDELVASSGGESCGIDLALRVVERYYGASVAKAAAYNMEYRRTPRPQNENDV